MITTVSACKAFRGIPSDNQDHDEELARLIVSAQAWLERECERTFEQGTVTQYFSGTEWRDSLMIARPPLASITNLWDDLARVYATPIPAANYVIADAEAGIIRLDGIRFQEGIHNIKLTYVGGFAADALPKDLEEAVIELVWAARIKGEQNLIGVRSRSIADGSVQFVNLDWGSGSLAAIIDKYKLRTGVA
jgi:hypothetical protein